LLHDTPIKKHNPVVSQGMPVVYTVLFLYFIILWCCINCWGCGISNV